MGDGDRRPFETIDGQEFEYVRIGKFTSEAEKGQKGKSYGLGRFYMHGRVFMV